MVVCRMLTWPSRVCSVTRSHPLSSRWVAKLCRMVCGRTGLLMPARCAACRHASQTNALRRDQRKLIDASIESAHLTHAYRKDTSQKPFFTYVQDKWQVGKKLTLDIGLRHEFWPPATPRRLFPVAGIPVTGECAGSKPISHPPYTCRVKKR